MRRVPRPGPPTPAGPRATRPAPRREGRRPRERAPAWSPSFRDHHHDVAVVDVHLVDRLGFGGRQGERLAGLERELAAVLPALDGPVLGVDLALGQRDVGVRAAVADGVELVADPHDGDAVLADVEAAGLTGCQVVEAAKPLLGAGLRRGCSPSRRSNLAAIVERSSGATEVTGARSSTSSKNPLTMSRSASSVATPRLSR